MGLDIHLNFDNEDKQLAKEKLSNKKDYFNKYSLSRTFCTLILRKNVIESEPELDQIGRLTNINITPFYDMEKHWDDNDAVTLQLSSVKNEIEKQAIIKRITADKTKLIDNINLVIDLVNSLINNLSEIDNLDVKLKKYGRDTLGYDYYFTDFNLDKGEGYIGNNFGQDLRNLKKSLELAKSNGAKSVWFTFG